MRTPIRVTETAGVHRRGEPVEIGLPFPAGQASPKTTCVVLDENENPLPSQFKTLVHYKDGTLRAVHGLFLIDLEPGQERTLSVVAGEQQVGRGFISEHKNGFRVETGRMNAAFNGHGELASLVLDGAEVLDLSAGPSLRLEVGLGPSGERLCPFASLTAKIKEAGPVRSIVNVRGKFALRDRRGPVEFVVDCDHVFYVGRPEIHLRPMLIGAVTESAQLNAWSLTLHLRNGKQVRYGSSPPLVRDDPNHENMTWRALDEGWASWRLANGLHLTAWSPDFQRHQNGLIRTEVLDQNRERLQVTFGRIEPFWGYHDVSNPAKPVTINRGGWRRWEAVFGFHDAGQSPQDCATRWRTSLRAFPSSEHYRSAYKPWLEGVSVTSELRERVAKKCEEFVCREPEYAGSLFGGYDAINRTFIERGVARGEFGEYLFHEFFRSGEPRFHRMAFDFGQVYRDVFCFTIPEAASGANELGAARMRQSEYDACHIRSYRGAVLLAYMYQETGDDRYLTALRQRAEFHLANYPNQIGRQGMSVRDTAFMADYLNRPELMQHAVRVALHSLDSHFDPEHGFYQDYQPLQKGEKRSRPVTYPGGYWNVSEFLHASNAKPEMTVYNIIGLYGLCRLHDPGETFRVKLRRVCEWFRDKQNKDGSWSYPQHSSRTRWGHGCLQDAMGMLMAYKRFGDRSYLDAAKRSVAFAERLLREHSRIPLIVGLSPFDQTEDSLVYYYGIETLALYEEALAEEEAK